MLSTRSISTVSLIPLLLMGNRKLCNRGVGRRHNLPRLAKPPSDAKAREVAFRVAQPRCDAWREDTGEHLRCIGGKGTRRGRGVLFEAADMARAGNRHDKRLLRQQPGK